MDGWIEAQAQPGAAPQIREKPHTVGPTGSWTDGRTARKQHAQTATLADTSRYDVTRGSEKLALETYGDVEDEVPAAPAARRETTTLKINQIQ